MHDLNQQLPSTVEELMSELADIDQRTELPLGDEPDALEKRSVLMQRRILLAQVRNILFERKKERFLQVRGIESIAGIRADSIGSLRRILAAIDSVDPDDARTVLRDPVAAALVQSALGALFTAEHELEGLPDLSIH